MLLIKMAALSHMDSSSCCSTCSCLKKGESETWRLSLRDTVRSSGFYAASARPQAAAGSTLPGLAQHLLDGDATACHGTVGAQPDGWSHTARTRAAGGISWRALHVHSRSV